MCLFGLKKQKLNANKNIIDAILNIVRDNMRSVGVSNNSHNRLHAIGEPLEEYIKDAFAGTIDSDTSTKLKTHDIVFSYGGGSNNPPDAMLDHGDAIEVKKVEKIASIPLNSSFPKAKLYSDDPKIASECRNAEGGLWKEKDIIYAIGCVKSENQLSSLALVYGDVYCANKECYERIFNAIKDGISRTGITMSETNELAHINAVDPLRITYFRARGMWGITHPFKVFDYIYKSDTQANFEMIAIIPKNKFDGFSNKEDLINEASKNNNLIIKDCQVKNPNNIVKLIDVKLITYKI